MNETIQDNADRPDPFAPLLNSPGSLPLEQSAKEPSTEIPDDKLSPSALKRRQERRLRESRSSLPLPQSAKEPSAEIPDYRSASRERERERNGY